LLIPKIYNFPPKRVAAITNTPPPRSAGRKILLTKANMPRSRANASMATPTACRDDLAFAAYDRMF
jgi:hypothetical protein